MKAPTVIVDPNMSQIKLEKIADLKTLAKKYARTIISAPDWDFFIFDGALYFAKRK